MEYEAVDDKLRRSRYFWRQLAVCITSTVFYFLIGLTLGSPTVTVPQLRKEANSTAAVSEEMASWLTSIMPYTATFWVLIIIIAAHYFGRKRPMIVIALNSLCGYILFYCSKNVFHVLLSQATQSLTQAAYPTTCGMMVLEYTSPHYRGLFLGFFSATYFWGIWAANIIESPFWLACQGRYDECAVVHRWLKGVDVESEKELRDLIEAQKEFKMSMTKTKKSLRDFIWTCQLVLRDPQIYKSLTSALMTIPPYLLSGKLVCAVYSLEIMKKLTKTESQAYMGILILDGFSVAVMYFGSFLLNRMKRRTLLIGSCITTSFFLLTISFSIYLVKSLLV